MPVSSSWWMISFRRRFFLCIRLCWVTHATQRQCPVMIMNSFSCEELWVIWPFLIPRSSLTSGPALFTPFFNSSCGFDPEGSTDLLMFCRQPEIVKYDQVRHFARQGLRGSFFCTIILSEDHHFKRTQQTRMLPLRRWLWIDYQRQSLIMV